MRRQAFSRAHLIVPAKTSGAVGGELDVVWRISVDEILRRDLERLEIHARKDPALQNGLELGKVPRVSDRFMLAEWHVEFAALIKTAEPIKAGPVQVVKKLRGFRTLPFPVFDQLIETAAMFVETFLFVSKFDSYYETLLQMFVKVYEVRIDVIQRGALWTQAERDCESTAEGLDVAPGRMSLPKTRKVRHQPSLSARPLQRRF